MKKTLTVNLGGLVYNIDEDAYALLDNYLKNLRFHFRNDHSANEIVNDIEERISELFNEYLASGTQVITLKEVENIIKRMGKPEDLDEPAQPAADEDKHEHGQATESEKVTRRLFRNPDDCILGGVASGIAAFLDWDPLLVRIALLILTCFSFGWMVLIYLVAWIIIPKASTATEKLQMCGRPVSMENIGKTVTDGFEKVNHYVRSGKPQSALHRIGELIVNCFGLLCKFALVLIGIACIPFLLVALIMTFAFALATIGIFVSIPGFFYDIFPQVDWSMLINTHSAWGISLAVCGILAVGIPLFGMLQLIFQSFRIWTPLSTTVKVILLLLWLAALTIGIVLFFHGYVTLLNPLY